MNASFDKNNFSNFLDQNTHYYEKSQFLSFISDSQNVTKNNVKFDLAKETRSKLDFNHYLIFGIRFLLDEKCN
jgi:hypothetical protein